MKRYFLLGLLVIILVLGAGIWYINRPQRVVTTAVNKFGQAKTAHFTTRLQLANGATGSVELVADGGFDRSHDGPATIGTTVNLATKTESVGVNVEGEVRFIGDKVYLFISKAPAAYALIQHIKGQWLQLARGGTSTTNTPAAGTLTFTDVKRVGLETIDEVPTVKYQATTSAEGVVHMMNSLAQVLGTQLTTDQIASLQASIPTGGTVPVTIWVQRWSQTLKRVDIVLAVGSGNNVNLSLTIKDVNQPVKVEAPKDAKPMADALKALATPTPVPPTPQP